MLETPKSELGWQDASRRIAAARHVRKASLHALLGGWLRGLAGTPRRLWRRRHLASLSDLQLKDAGIDPALAGKGRASAARLDPNLEGLR